MKAKRMITKGSSGTYRPRLWSEPAVKSPRAISCDSDSPAPLYLPSGLASLAAACRISSVSDHNGSALRLRLRESSSALPAAPTAVTSLRNGLSV
jgi:hypothetical protein